MDLALSAVDGAQLDSVHYEISGPNDFTKSGDIDVTNSLRISALIGGIPANSGYTIQLSGSTGGGTSTTTGGTPATAGDASLPPGDASTPTTAGDMGDASTPSGLSCSGQGMFDVMAGMTTSVTVHMQCKGMHKNGSVLVNGTLNICPTIDELSILPCETTVGHSVKLVAVGTDPDNGPSPLSYTWSASSGTVANPSAANTTFTCTQPGTSTVTLNISDGDCGDAATGTVTCDVGPGASDGGASDAAPEGDGGVPVVVPDSGTTADASAPVDSGAGESLPDSGTGGGVDLSGTWATEIKTSGTLTVPVIGTQTASIDIVTRLYVQNTSGGLSAELEICRLNSVVPNMLTVDFPASVLALGTSTMSEAAVNAMVGGTVPLPAFDISLGEDASGGQVDQDRDGNPGVTVPATLDGTNLNTYIGVSIKSQLTATLQSATTIAGNASFSASGQVFGGSPLNLTGSIAVTPASPTVAYSATHASGNVPCSTVLGHFQ